MNARTAGLIVALAASTPALGLDFPHHGGSSSGGARCDTCTVGLAIGALTVDVTMLAVDVILLANGAWLPIGWAAFEELLAILNGGVGLIFSAAGAAGLALGVENSGTLLGAGLLLLIIAGVMTVHAIVSVVKRLQKKEPLISIAPVPGGAAAFLIWRF